MKNLGYYNSNLDILIELKENNLVNITYKINLGKKSKIKKITFIGDKIFKDKVYKRDDGQWLDFCVGMLAMVKRGTKWTEVLKIGEDLIGDKSASCNFEVKDSSENYQAIQTWLVDFELMKAKVGYARRKQNGEWSQFGWFNEWKCTAF